MNLFIIVKPTFFICKFLKSYLCNWSCFTDDGNNSECWFINVSHVTICWAKQSRGCSAAFVRQLKVTVISLILKRFPVKLLLAFSSLNYSWQNFNKVSQVKVCLYSKFWTTSADQSPIHVIKNIHYIKCH